MPRNSRLKRVLAITILLVMALSTFAIAANGVYEKAVTAVLGRIKFKVDGKDVTKEIESKYGSPAFVVKEYGSRAYVPVRAIAELMGLEIEWDDETHTAEIIDAKSEKYKEELEKKDKEIAELKKEIKNLKGNVKESEKENKEESKKEETDLKTLEKQLNKEFGTYEDVEFDITLKESKSKISVNIVMDLRDGRQENYWNRMKYSDRKALIEDIVDIILSEYENLDISGSIYDEFSRRDVMTFSKKKNSKLTFSYDNREGDINDREIDEIVYREFGNKAYLSGIDTSGYDIYLEIDIPYRADWRDLSQSEIIRSLDRISDRVFYYYDYDYYNYGYDRVTIEIYVDDKYEATYYRNYNEDSGRLK